MPRTSRPMSVFPITMRELSVLDITDVTPNMRRITLGGPALRGGRVSDGNGGTLELAPFRSAGFDDHVKLVIPPVEGELPALGTQGEYRFNWNPAVFGMSRDYTGRSVDLDQDRFTIDVVRHDSGLASEWAYRCRPGDAINVAGTKTSAGSPGRRRRTRQWPMRTCRRRPSPSSASAPPSAMPT